MNIFSIFLTLITALSCQAEVISVKDVKGRPLSIDLIALSNDKVIFTKAGKTQQYTLPIDKFAESSQTKINEVGATLPPLLPELSADVTISKRRDKGNSYYMVKQKLHSVIKLKNTSNTIPCPPCKGTMVFIGQDRKNTDLYTVLQTSSFDVQIDIAQSIEHTTPGFSTRYDSDNKGRGNLGGSQYIGYILAVKTEDGQVVFHKTSNAVPTKAVKNDPTLLDSIEKYSDEMRLSETLKPRNYKKKRPRTVKPRS